MLVLCLQTISKHKILEENAFHQFHVPFENLWKIVEIMKLSSLFPNSSGAPPFPSNKSCLLWIKEVNYGGQSNKCKSFHLIWFKHTVSYVSIRMNILLWMILRNRITRHICFKCFLVTIQCMREHLLPIMRQKVEIEINWKELILQSILSLAFQIRFDTVEMPPYFDMSLTLNFLMRELLCGDNKIVNFYLLPILHIKMTITFTNYSILSN